MEEPATQDLRGYRAAAAAAAGDRQAARARARATRCARCAPGAQAGAHRRDLDRDGTLRARGGGRADGRLVAAAGRGPVQARPGRRRVRAALEKCSPLGDHTRGSPDAPDFFDGWWGYVVEGPADPVRQAGARAGAAPTAAGARGQRAARALRRSLREALGVTPRAALRPGDCADDPQPDCFDRNRSIVASGISIGAFPFQNRPDLPADGLGHPQPALSGIRCPSLQASHCYPSRSALRPILYACGPTPGAAGSPFPIRIRGR